MRRFFFCQTAPAVCRPVTHSYSRWYYDPRKVVAVATTVPLIGIGIGIGIGGAVIAAAADYGGYLETVPYTNRTHLVLRSPLQEREVGEFRFACLKEKNARVILDPHHPDAGRVNNIASTIVYSLVHLTIVVLILN